MQRDEATAAFDAVVEASRIIDNAPATLDMIRVGWQMKTGNVAKDAARRMTEIEEKDAGGGWMLMDRMPSLDVQTERALTAEALASVLCHAVVSRDTPAVDHVCRAQLRNQPKRVDAEQACSLVLATLWCYDEIKRVARIDEQIALARRIIWRSNSVNPDYVTCDVTRQLHGVEKIAVHTLWESNIFRVEPRTTLYVTSVDTLARIFHTRDLRESPSAELILLLARAAPMLPVDIVQRIVHEACATKHNALHCALDRANSWAAKTCRAKLDAALAIVITCESIFHSKDQLLRVHHVLRDRRDRIVRLERTMARCNMPRDSSSSDDADSPPAKRTRVKGSQDEEDVSMPRLNTLVVCDVATTKQLKSHADLCRAGLRVRTLESTVHRAHMSMGLHADIICVNPLALRSLRTFTFKRCIFLSCTMHRTNLCGFVHADHTWIARTSVEIVAPALQKQEIRHIFPKDEAELVGLPPPLFDDLPMMVVAM